MKITFSHWGLPAWGWLGASQQIFSPPLVSPAAERLRYILGDDDEPPNPTLFTEMDTLQHDGEEMEWKESARWEEQFFGSKMHQPETPTPNFLGGNIALCNGLVDNHHLMRLASVLLAFCHAQITEVKRTWLLFCGSLLKRRRGGRFPIISHISLGCINPRAGSFPIPSCTCILPFSLLHSSPLILSSSIPLSLCTGILGQVY